jgi:hypothetical protein
LGKDETHQDWHRGGLRFCKSLKLFGYQFCNFVGVQSGTLAQVVAHNEQLDRVWKVK